MPSSYEKRIYQAAVSQSFRNTGLVAIFRRFGAVWYLHLQGRTVSPHRAQQSLIETSILLWVIYSSAHLWLPDCTVSQPWRPCITAIKVKVKCSRYSPGVAQRLGRGIALLFHDRGIRRGWVVSSTPRPHFTPGKDPVPIFTGGWVGSRTGLDGRKISPPPGFDHGSPNPQLSRYTDWAARPTILVLY